MWTINRGHRRGLKVVLLVVALVVLTTACGCCNGVFC
jgi:hypothetical protein